MIYGKRLQLQQEVTVHYQPCLWNLDLALIDMLGKTVLIVNVDEKNIKIILCFIKNVEG